MFQIWARKQPTIARVKKALTTFTQVVDILEPLLDRNCGEWKCIRLKMSIKAVQKKNCSLSRELCIFFPREEEDDGREVFKRKYILVYLMILYHC